VNTTPEIQTYGTWAKQNDKKCRRFSHWETSSTQVFRVTDRQTILHNAGFRQLGGTDVSADFRTPLKAVKNFIEDWAADLVHVLYWTDGYHEINVWGK
jgi:hypothetical protein